MNRILIIISTKLDLFKFSNSLNNSKVETSNLNEFFKFFNDKFKLK